MARKDYVVASTLDRKRPSKMLERDRRCALGVSVNAWVAVRLR